MIEDQKREPYLEYLARCAREGDGPKPMAAPKVREIALGKRLGVCWMPPGCASWPFRAYYGSGHRFLKVGRLSFWIRWAYD